LAKLPRPKCYASDNDWFNDLYNDLNRFNINEQAGLTQGLVPYWFFPNPGSDARNSNSFIAGLLNATGTYLLNLSQTFPSIPGDWPGASVPVPLNFFSPLPTGASTPP